MRGSTSGRHCQSDEVIAESLREDWQRLSAARLSSARPCSRGKFIFLGADKLTISGVTYGTFRPDELGNDFHPSKVTQDFAAMAANGINALRTYTVPPRWFLDLASKYNLCVMVGIPWEQHITFLDEPARIRSIEERVRLAVKSCAGHPAVLCCAIGNEISSSIVRWYGHARIERFLNRLYQLAKKEDPDGLVTYVNYPTTEYLDLPFLDLVCFNVYLESRDSWKRYLGRLQNLAGERPLLLAEVGLDSQRNGEVGQAQALRWLIQGAFASGCAGAFVFGWTDEWYRGGFEILDWDFGLTRRDRTDKAALETVRQVFTEGPFPAARNWPSISVVVCSYNGHRTIRDTLEGLATLRYPAFEVIVVDDGSSPPLEPLVAPYGFRTIRTLNRGLSAARNTGLEAAEGEIVAYLDDDAYPDQDWLTYLADSFLMTDHSGIGGPNIAPVGDGRIADCVANAPGGPVHVLLSDDLAEHIPGCNMAFRKAALQAVGGFDPRFRVAGDDVDVCWSLQRHGRTLGFNPAAVVWHHRRNSICAYWKQQKGYGRAEVLLQKKWPEKYNLAGHLSWTGRIYGKGLVHGLVYLNRIYQGIWGEAPFQSVYQTGAHGRLSLLLMPEWYLIVLILGITTTLCWRSEGLRMTAPLFLLSVAAPIIQAWHSSSRATFLQPPKSALARLGLRLFTAFLYILQPIARLSGRLRYGMAPWRMHRDGFCVPYPRRYSVWSETWQSPGHWLGVVERSIRSMGAPPLRGGACDRWDLEISGGIFGTCRVLMAVEEHGAGRQLMRFRCWPRLAPFAVVLFAIFTAAAAASINHAPAAAAFLGISALLLFFQAARQSGAAMAAADSALGHFDVSRRPNPYTKKIPFVTWSSPEQLPTHATAVASETDGDD